MAQVLVAGSAVLDFVYRIDSLPVGGEKYRAEGLDIVGGGCAANACVAIQRLGGQAQLVARFGRDEVFDLVTRDLALEGVDLQRLEVVEGARSSVSSIYVDAQGERQIMNYRGADLPDKPTEQSITADCILADTRWPEATRRLFAQAARQGLPRILDGEAPVPQDIVVAATHVIFSEQGLADFAQMDDMRNALTTVAKRYSAWVAVTLGAKGVLWYDGAAVRHMPGFEVVAIDSLGAGDVWHGAFALRLAEGAYEEDAMRFANGVAALKCTQPGGRKATPTRIAVEQFLKDRT